MSVHEVIYWGIAAVVFMSTAFGLVHILKKNYLRYGLVTSISLFLSTFLCILFYKNGFYRFVLPLPYILLVVATSFTYLVLFSICYRPRHHTFTFYFMTINLVFAMELILRYTLHFIVYRGPWDTWDSYSLYWFYIRFFAYLGDWLVPLKYRNPISTETRTYWVMFVIVLIGTILGFLFVFNQWHMR